MTQLIFYSPEADEIGIVTYDTHFESVFQIDYLFLAKAYLMSKKDPKEKYDWYFIGEL